MSMLIALGHGEEHECAVDEVVGAAVVKARRFRSFAGQIAYLAKDNQEESRLRSQVNTELIRRCIPFTYALLDMSGHDDYDAMNLDDQKMEEYKRFMRQP
jgi:hypothetical protein